jgi:hypothetical protein
MTTEERIDQILTELLADYKRVSTYRVARAKQQLIEVCEGVIGLDESDLTMRLLGLETSRVDTRNNLRAEQRQRLHEGGDSIRKNEE